MLVGDVVQRGEDSNALFSDACKKLILKLPSLAQAQLG